MNREVLKLKLSVIVSNTSISGNEKVRLLLELFDSSQLVPEIEETIGKEALDYAHKQVPKVCDTADLNERWFERYHYLLNNFNHYRKSLPAQVKPANDDIYGLIKKKKEYYETLLEEDIENKDYGACFICEKKIDVLIELMADSLSV